MNTPTKPCPSRHLIFGDMWLALALMALAEIRSAAAPLALVLHENGSLEALAPSHPDYATSIILPGFVCLITPASHPYRIAARIRAVAEQARVAA